MSDFGNLLLEREALRQQVAALRDEMNHAYAQRDEARAELAKLQAAAMKAPKASA